MRRLRSNLELLHMNFGFFGIQFGWSLQMANMSAIYEFLGAKPDQIPGLWLAAPLTGLLVQPLIGYLSDRTWTRLGRRRPYFLTGAILSTLALLAMPNVTGLFMAATLLWVLDASINISMEPFRAFVSDLLPSQQRTRGFAMQSLLIGLASVFASSLPSMLHNLPLPPSPNAIPNTVRWAFYIGAFVFLGAVVWTVCTTGEDPPVPEAKPEPGQQTIPAEIWRLAPIQVVTWLGLFMMWIYFAPTVARHVFMAPNQTSPLYSQGIEFAGVCFSFYSLVTFLFSFCLEPLARRLGEGRTHGLCLALGGLGLLSVAYIHAPYMLFFSMTGIGIAWCSILSMPYAILARHIKPESAGLTMGIFNFFIVLPEIAMALGFGWVMKNWLHEDRLAALSLGGCFLLLASVMSFAILGRGEKPAEALPAESN